MTLISLFYLCISVFLVECMIGYLFWFFKVLFWFQVYAMLEYLVDIDTLNPSLLGKCLAIHGYYQNYCRRCFYLVVYKTLKTNNLNAPLGGMV